MKNDSLSASFHFLLFTRSPLFLPLYRFTSSLKNGYIVIRTVCRRSTSTEESKNPWMFFERGRENDKTRGDNFSCPPGCGSCTRGISLRRKQSYPAPCINTGIRCRCKVDTEHTCYVPGPGSATGCSLSASVLSKMIYRG